MTLPIIATDADFVSAANLIPCDVNIFRAFTLVESRGHGFMDNGFPTCLVEPHIIWKYATTKERLILAPKHLAYPRQGQYPYGTYASQELDFNEISSLTRPDLAIMGTSWGLFQIMGFNYKLCGFNSPSDFFAAMCKSEIEQIKAAAIMMRSEGFAPLLRSLDYHALAEKWNGPGNASIYAAKLQNAYHLVTNGNADIVVGAKKPDAPTNQQPSPVALNLSPWQWFLYGLAMGYAKGKLIS